MASETQLTRNGTSWYVITTEGRSGPLDSAQEAVEYARLLQLSLAAGCEIACTEDECLT